MQIKQLTCASLLLASIGISNVHAHEIYLKGGFLGLGGGYSYSINDYLGVRGEYTKFNYNMNDKESGDFHYDAKLKSDHKSVYVDVFPFGGTFRLTAGLAKRDFGLTVNGYVDDENGITIGDTTLSKNQLDDYRNKAGITGEVNALGNIGWKKTSPYLGLGFGHGSGKGLGFVFDVGVYMGGPSVKLHTSDALYTMADAEVKLNKLEQQVKNNDLDKYSDAEKLQIAQVIANAKANGYVNVNDINNLPVDASAQTDIDKQIDELNEDVKDFKLIPAIHLGISYRF